MRILVDLDNTVLDSYGVVFQLYEMETGVSPLPFDPHQMEARIEAYCPLVTSRRIDEYFVSDEFYRRVKPFKGAIETLRAWHELGHEIIVVSLQRHPQRAKHDWVKMFLPFVSEIHLLEFDDLNTIDKSSVHGDLIIDDSVGALESSVAPYKICLQHYQGYNSHWTGWSASEWNANFRDFVEELGDDNLRMRRPI